MHLNESVLITPGNFVPTEFESPLSRNKFLETVHKEQELLENYKDEATPSTTYPLYKSYFHGFFAIYIIAEDKVQFNVLIKPDYKFEHSMVFQHSIYRDKAFQGHINKLATHVFWTYTLDMAGIVITTGDQYADAVKFWKRRIEEVLHQSSYHVYRIDLDDRKQRFIPITKETWTKDQKWIWGTSDKHYPRRALISKTKLD